MKAKFDIEFSMMTVREFILMSGSKGNWVASPARSYSDDQGLKKYYNFVIFPDDKKEPFQKKCMELLEPLVAEQAVSEQAYVQEECPF